MKIQSLHLCNYKQFSDLELDLTYPQGHKKAGEPLDKICIIGQSGTGKTNLLEVIKKSTIDFSGQSKNSYLPFSEFVGKDTDDRYISTAFKTSKSFEVETLFTTDTSKITLSNKTEEDTFLEGEKNYFVSTVRCENKNDDIESEEIDIKKMSDNDKKLYDKLINARNELVLASIHEKKSSSIPGFEWDRLIYGNIGSPRKKTVSEKEREIKYAIKEIEDRYIPVSNAIDKLKQSNFIDKFIVNINEENNSWNLLKNRIDNYELEKTKHIKVLSSKILHDDSYSKDGFKQDMALWEKENENILEKIADDINNIIQKFNLELKINKDTQSYEELIIKDLANDNIIEYDDLSTGTQNLLSTFIPLKIHKPKNSIILIDEPEMSFYPDIQRQLTELYTGVGKNNQLIVATHSPLIASSFEPWEVVELKFDKNSQIYREEYYEGENHIDNYTVDPRMLTWTGILTDVFDLKEDSNFTFREAKLMEYATLKAEIKDMKDKATPTAIEKIKNFRKLSSLLGLQN